jgi:hypothetical protein
MLSDKTKSHAFLLLKIMLFAVTAGYIIYRLFFYEQNAGIPAKWGFPLSFFSLLLVCLTLGGMLLNWGLETLKWRMLYSKVARIGMGEAWKGVLSGSAVSMWMPNRMGDYLGRILYLPGNHYGKAVICSAMGSMAQFGVTLLFGLAGMAWWVMSDQSSGNTVWLPALVAAVVFVVLSCIYLFLPVFIHWRLLI